MSENCARAYELATLVDYLDGDLPAAEADGFEEHLFVCAACAQRSDSLAALAAGVRQALRAGHVPFVLTDALSMQLAADGAKTREFRIEAGGVTPCGVAQEDELLIVHLVADLDGVVRASLTMDDDSGALAVRHDDVPLVVGGTSLRIGYPGALIRALPDTVAHLVLTTETADDLRRTTKYTLLHSHAGPPRVD